MNDSMKFEGIWKKFRRGEKFNSLRDAIPAFFKNALNTKAEEILADQEFWAVKDVSFSIKKGEVVGIMGLNGAGKSTILKLLSRIMFPTRGRITIHGRLSALIEVTAGFHPDLTGRENVYLNGAILGMKRKEIDAKFDQIVDFSGIAEFIDTPVKRYSSGMYSRLGFSVAAHVDPEILLVDEVLSVGDISFQARCAEKMRDLLKSGVTIILVSHNLALIQSLCQRAILVDHGQVLRDGTTIEVLPHYENIVLKMREDMIHRRIEDTSGRGIKAKVHNPVMITGVGLFDQLGQSKNRFQLGDELHLAIHYRAIERIESPIFSVEIIRADGVVCCLARTDVNNPLLPYIQGEGRIKLDFGVLNLGAGIYQVKVVIYDQVTMHPYVTRAEEIVRFDAGGNTIVYQPIFYPPSRWEIRHLNPPSREKVKTVYENDFQ